VTCAISIHKERPRKESSPAQKVYRESHRERLNQQSLKYYHDNRDERLVYERRQRAEERNRVLMFLGGKCEWCFINDSRLLHIDHVNGGGLKEKLTIGQRGILRRVLTNPQDYQLLCANCNTLKRWFELEEYKPLVEAV